MGTDNYYVIQPSDFIIKLSNLAINQSDEELYMHNAIRLANSLLS